MTRFRHPLAVVVQGQSDEPRAQGDRCRLGSLFDSMFLMLVASFTGDSSGSRHLHNLGKEHNRQLAYLPMVYSVLTSGFEDHLCIIMSDFCILRRKRPKVVNYKCYH